MTRVLTLERPEPKEINTFIGGAGNGGERMIDNLERFNAASTALAVRATIADPKPQKAAALAARATARGLPAVGVEQRVEELATTTTGDVHIFLMDRPGGFIPGFQRSITMERPVLAYLLVKADRKLYLVSMALQAHEAQHKRMAMKLMEHLDTITARRGSRDVLGADGLPEHVATMPQYRAKQEEHAREQLPKLVSAVEPTVPPYTIFDGTHTQQLLIAESRGAWQEPHAISRRALTHELKTPIIPGEDLMILELGPNGVRFHTTRVRTTDGQISVRGTVAADDRNEEERQQRITQQALRGTFSAWRPLLTAD